MDIGIFGKELLVEIVITARNRADELALTLSRLKTQTCRNVRLTVIDDASSPSLEPVVRAAWPKAVFLRNETCQGLIANRNRATGLSDADLVVNLDDDCSFTRDDDLSRAVAVMRQEPGTGIIAFKVFQGTGAVPEDAFGGESHYVPSFMGGAHMIRKQVVEQMGGFREFYFYYGEEAEYAMRVWDSGWHIRYYPEVVVHHRVSAIGRRSDSILRHNLRNNLWTTILLIPWPRVVFQLAWRIFSYTIESGRLLQWRAYLSGLASCAAGLPLVIRLRRPIRKETLALLDSMSSGIIHTPAELANYPKPSLKRFLTHHWQVWVNRPRARPFWDRRPGHLGECPTVMFDHGLAAQREKERR